MSIINYSQKTSVENNLKEVCNTITGSAGGWPSNTHAGILQCYDFTIEETTNDLKIYEYNTNIMYSAAETLFSDLPNDITTYVASKGYDNVVVYGSTEFDIQNPGPANALALSSSFAAQNISSSFNYVDSAQYLAMRGDSNESNTFHLFIQSPTHTDDNIHKMVSGSWNKSHFRTFLASSNHSDYLIDSFNSSSISNNVGDYPDYVVKTNTGDASFYGFDTSIHFNSYLTDYEQNIVDSGSWTDPEEGEQYWEIMTDPTSSMAFWYDYDIQTGYDKYTEKYIISSGSVDGTRRFLGNGRAVYLSTPTEVLTIGSYFDSKFALLKPPAGTITEDTRNYTWNIKGYNGPSTPQGTNIRMYDGSTKAVENVAVGDVVKSYYPIGMSMNDIDFFGYSTNDLSGSYASGSVVVGTYSRNEKEYNLLNGSIKIPELASIFVNKLGVGHYKFIKGYEVEVGDELYKHDGSWVEVTSAARQSSATTFYSLDVEDIDTYFSSDILVHNLPKK
tara:strand:- start:10780 stop:12288 length:1509 start_codon:yes stop_codon:yes gene_type:complete